jgi:hypothetical protein
MKKITLATAILLLIITGCSYKVPLKHEFALENPPAIQNEKILVVMSPEQAGKVINYSPQVGDTYVFSSGPALKNLIINILGQLYSEVSYAESIDIANTNYDRAIEVVLQNYEITMNIYKGNTVNLDIDYTIHNQKGASIKLPTKSSSKERYKGSDYVNTILLGSFYNIGKMKQKTGAAWDMAAINSIGELIDRLAKKK